MFSNGCAATLRCLGCVIDYQISSIVPFQKHWGCTVRCALGLPTPRPNLAPVISYSNTCRPYPWSWQRRRKKEEGPLCFWTASRSRARTHPVMSTVGVLHWHLVRANSRLNIKRWPSHSLPGPIGTCRAMLTVTDMLRILCDLRV